MNFIKNNQRGNVKYNYWILLTVSIQIYLYKQSDCRNYTDFWLYVVFLFQGSVQTKIENNHSSDSEAVDLNGLDDSQDTDQVRIGFKLENIQWLR